MNRSSARTRAVAVVLGGVLLVASGCGTDGSASGSGSTSGSDGASTDFSGYVRQPIRSVQAVSLPATDGSTVTMAASAPGGLRIVFFGYTSCPDVCPTTMADLEQALGSVPAADRAKVQVDMVSVDPARDTPAKLGDYVATFVADGAGLRTDDQAALRTAARAFGADYSVTAGADGQPQVTHTSDVFVVDDAGRIVLAWPYGTRSRAIAKDIRRLLAGDLPPEDMTTSTSTVTTTSVAPS